MDSVLVERLHDVEEAYEETLRSMADPDVLGDSDRYTEVAKRHAILDNARGRGLMLGVDVIDPSTGERNPMSSLMLEAECLQRGVVLGYSALSGVVRLLPPLTITERQLETATDLVEETLEDVAKHR